MRKKEKREKEFQKFVDIGGLDFLRKAEMKEVQRKKDEERKKQEVSGIMEFLAYLVSLLFIIAVIVGTYFLVYFEGPKSILDKVINSIMEGRY
ncbi:hypothetical protein [Enterococcus rotai]|uniref:hypothetical protein n=1 Tax=Enterococcus rotai TaxID=118060 RepID=UPI0032B4A988